MIIFLILCFFLNFIPFRQFEYGRYGIKVEILEDNVFKEVRAYKEILEVPKHKENYRYL